MDFTPQKRLAREDSIVPMINVVFLLLIFFLMTAQITPPEAFEVTLPTAVAEAPATQPEILLLGADGTPGFGAARGAAALAALGARAKPGMAVLIRADAKAPAAKLAALLRRLAGLGIDKVALATRLP